MPCHCCCCVFGWAPNYVEDTGQVHFEGIPASRPKKSIVPLLAEQIVAVRSRAISRNFGGKAHICRQPLDFGFGEESGLAPSLRTIQWRIWRILERIHCLKPQFFEYCEIVINGPCALGLADIAQWLTVKLWKMTFLMPWGFDEKCKSGYIAVGGWERDWRETSQ